MAQGNELLKLIGDLHDAAREILASDDLTDIPMREFASNIVAVTDEYLDYAQDLDSPIHLPSDESPTL